MSNATSTDLYEVTMAQSYLSEGMTGSATFSLFVRNLPPDRGFLVCAGLESVLDFLSAYRVDADDVDVFASVMGRRPEDLAPLLGLEFSGEVRAVPEGRIVLAGEPLLEITAPLPQAQLVETYVLNQLNHQTAIASKCARCVLAADGHQVVDFSLRRTHGIEAGHRAARLGAMVGFAGTSNVETAHAEGLSAVGTMAHSYIEAFGLEEGAFRAFARSHPGPVTLLVDTYDTVTGVATAARVLRDLGLGPGCAIRLDSGDLGALAVRARTILDAAGLQETRIVASGGLDEFAVDSLVGSGAPIDTYAVGTRIGVSADAPLPGFRVQAGRVRRSAGNEAFFGQGDGARAQAGVPKAGIRGSHHSHRRTAASGWRPAAGVGHAGGPTRFGTHRAGHSPAKVRR